MIDLQIITGFLCGKNFFLNVLKKDFLKEILCLFTVTGFLWYFTFTDI